MIEILGVPSQALLGQLLLGMINGSFYALLSLGLAVIFGMLNIINFAHGVQYMMGAFCAWLLLTYFGIGYWGSILLAPLIVGAIAMIMERLLLRPIYGLDHLYGFLLTYGLALIIEGVFTQIYGVTGQPYDVPAWLQGRRDLGFASLPYYRAWVVGVALFVCVATWYMIEHTRLGRNLRAATENASLVGAFGINVPRMITLTYGFGAGLAALAGVMAAPIYQVSSQMGSNIIVVVLAVIVIGGMGSIPGALLSGFFLGILEGLTKVFYPQASTTIIFVVMVIVLLIKPAGLFGKISSVAHASFVPPQLVLSRRTQVQIAAAIAAVCILAPFVVYPVFLMKAFLFALFASAFGLLLGYGGMLSFGHAAFFGGASYVTAHAVKMWGVPPEVGILLGTAFACLLGAVFGLIAVRRQGIYFAMVTLAFAQMFYFLMLQVPATGGEDGIQMVPRGRLFGLLDLNQPYVMYYFVLAVCVIGFAIVYRTIHSPFGMVVKVIRENESRAISLGYDTNRYKFLIFVISATLAGLAGSTKSLVFQIASLTDVHWPMSGEVVLMTLVGGLGTLAGPVVGAFALVSMEHFLVEIGTWLTAIQGLVFVVCVLAFRRGFVGEALVFLSKRRNRQNIGNKNLNSAGFGS